MATSQCSLFLLLLAVQGTLQRSTPASPTYKAAVVEFKPRSYLNDAQSTLRANAQKIIDYMEQAAAEDVDIIVFPEFALTSLDIPGREYLSPWTTPIPDPSENYNTCKNSTIAVNKYVRKIACAARKYSMYIVLNVIEEAECLAKHCRPDGVYYYITNAVFDRSGRTVARYRKNHLLDEFDWFDTLKTPEHGTFHTDFGVTFGNIICFDIMFEDPWLIEATELNVTDFVLASGWFSEMPFLTALQVQFGWAYAEDVNLLAGGYNRITGSDSGSGIYAGRDGIVTAVLSLVPHEELLVGEVRKKSRKTNADSKVYHDHKHQSEETEESSEDDGQKKFDEQQYDPGMYRWRYNKVNAYVSHVIDESGFIEKRLSHDNIHCDFRINVSHLRPPVTYRLLAHDSYRPTGPWIKLGVRLCAIVECANATTNSCGHITKSTAIFNSVNITATYVDNGRTTMLPSTLGTNMYPLKNWDVNEQKHKRLKRTSIYLTKPTKNLVTFGFWGRNFEVDELNTPEMPW